MLSWTLGASTSDVTARAGPSAWDAWMIPPLWDLQYCPATRDSLIKNPVWRNLSGSASVASARSGGIQTSAVDSARLLRLLRYGEWTSERSAARTDRKHHAQLQLFVILSLLWTEWCFYSSFRWWWSERFTFSAASSCETASSVVFRCDSVGIKG